MSTCTVLFNVGEFDISYDSQYDRIKFKYLDSWIPFSVHSFMLFLNTLSFKFLESHDELSLTIRQFPSSIELFRLKGNYIIMFISATHPSRMVISATSIKLLTTPMLMEKVKGLQKGENLHLPGEYDRLSERSYF